MTATAGYLGAAALAAEHLDALVVSGVRDVHTSVADRVHRLTDRLGGRVEHRVHDAVSGAIYGSIGVGLRSGARAMRALDRYEVGPSIEDDARGRFVLSAVNGLIGDRLRDEVPEMYFDAGVRVEGRDVELTREGLAAAYPGAGDTVVVFVHGLCETEDYWRRRSRPKRADGTTAPTYGDRLARHGWTPVHVRYNSGLPITENAAALSALLARVVEGWPVEVRKLALVGHSMGGLVLRAACAVSGDRDWTDRVCDVVCLGTPHLGAPLERAVARGSRWLGWVPETAAFARILEYRSVGILDLRHGLAGDVVNLPHARYHLVAGSLTRSPRHPVALAIGDLLVQPRSALGRPRHGAELFPGADTVHVPGADHFDLLNHDDVYAALEGWLA